MDTQFWKERWEANNIGFHESQPNPALTRYCERLELARDNRVLVPLCGKTLDIPWLRSQGYRVVGVELSELATRQLFEGLQLSPRITSEGALTRYSTTGIDIHVGDFFDLEQSQLGTVDAIYDRAALIALPPVTRERYTAHLMQLTNCAPQLLVSVEYDQRQMPGPPFSVDAAEITRHYGTTYRLEQLSRAAVPGGLKGQCDADEVLWLLSPAARKS